MAATPSLALKRPPRLGAGARVALIAPSGPLRSHADLERAVENARALGWEPTVGEHALARDGFFAGRDEQRAADLSAAIADPSIDGIWCLRGGYGAARLLPAVDLDAVRARPKPLIGYSDITALHAAWQRAGVVSFHGPVARGVLSRFSKNSLVRAVAAGDDSAGGDSAGGDSAGGDSAGWAVGSAVLRGGAATGRLMGGNLALVASLCGTPWAIDFRGAIIVLEDINEATYRVDRMLNQLVQAGAFDGCVGFAFGQCTHCDEQTDDGAQSLEAVLRGCVNRLQVPALMGIPMGHIEDQWTLPLGALASLDTATQTLRVHDDGPA